MNQDAKTLRKIVFDALDLSDELREECTDAVVAALTRNAVVASDEKLGEFIYRAMYEHKGGLWQANETKDVWYEIAARFRALSAPTVEGEGRRAD